MGIGRTALAARHTPNGVSRMRGYVQRAHTGELAARAAQLRARLSPCTLCPRRCGALRLADERGACGVGYRALLATPVVHRGEEPVISGSRGSGTVFLGGCNLRCLFCQNHQISRVVRYADGSYAGHGPSGSALTEVSAATLAESFLHLQRQGCHNLNFVSPSHVVPQLLEALDVAVPQGLDLPIVWNSNAYEDVSVLQALDGVVDVYLPDLKYSGDGIAERCSGVRGYVAASRAALREMARQVGPLVIDDEGVAQRGLIVRHLVLPRGAAGTAACLRFIADHLPRGVAVSLMAQYAPAATAYGHPILGRRLLPEEYDKAVAALSESGLEIGWVQDLEESPEHYRPDFREAQPFEY